MVVEFDEEVVTKEKILDAAGKDSSRPPEVV